MSLVLKDNDDKKPEDDKLNRNPSIVSLTNLVENIVDPYVIAINAKWGNGKTTFIKFWKQHLEDNGFNTILFNAWENDFQNEALSALLGEVDDFISKTNDDKLAKKFEKVKNAGVKILKNIIPTIIKLITGGVLSLDAETEKTLCALTENITKDFINDYKEKKKGLKEFKEKLKEIAEELYKKTQKPLIFFIDEIDRCRPTYAIEVLEKAKHFFSIPKIIFVVAVDKEELGKSIQSVYGQIDTDGYLRRFFDQTYDLPSSWDEYYIKFLFKVLKIKNKMGDNIFYELFKLTKFSLRQIHQCLTSFKLIMMSNKNSDLIEPLTIPMLILKNHRPEYYYKIINGELNSKQIIIIYKEVFGEDFINCQNEYKDNFNSIIMQSYAIELYDDENKSHFNELDKNGKIYGIIAGHKRNIRNINEIKRQYINELVSLDGFSV